MGLFGELFKPKYTKWQTYLTTRPVQRNDITNFPGMKIDRKYSQMNAITYYHQYLDSIKLIEKTKNPDVFFDKYDFAITRIIGLIYMKKYVKIEGSDLPETAEKLIDHKQKFVQELIDRCTDALDAKVSKLKTNKSKLNNIDKFEKQFEPYYCEMSQDNIDYVKRAANFYRLGCE